MKISILRLLSLSVAAGLMLVQHHSAVVVAAAAVEEGTHVLALSSQDPECSPVPILFSSHLLLFLFTYMFAADESSTNSRSTRLRSSSSSKSAVGDSDSLDSDDEHLTTTKVKEICSAVIAEQEERATTAAERHQEAFLEQLKTLKAELNARIDQIEMRLRNDDNDNDTSSTSNLLGEYDDVPEAATAMQRRRRLEDGISSGKILRKINGLTRRSSPQLWAKKSGFLKLFGDAYKLLSNKISGQQRDINVLEQTVDGIQKTDIQTLRDDLNLQIRRLDALISQTIIP